ncbi:MAG: Fic family protein [Gemmatimonadota bacterium]
MARKGKQAVARQRERVADVLSRLSGKAGRAEIEVAYQELYGESIAWRTLLRRLAELETEGRLVSEGSPRNRTYRLNPDQPADAPLTGKTASDTSESEEHEQGIPLSPQARADRSQVRRAIIHRAPVGYDRDFLGRYEPGTTWYIAEATRARLHEIGRTPDSDRPAGTFAGDVLNRLLIDLSWASSRLEGNTYDRLDTKNLIEFGQQAAGKSSAEAQMILNHKSAIEFLVENAQTVGFDLRTLRALHAHLASNLLADPGDEGRLRERPVLVSGTTFTPLAIPQVIHDGLQSILHKATRIPDPFEQAFFVSVHIPYLQPFVDVNKRTGRLAANIPLIRQNLCPLSFVEVPQRDYVEAHLSLYENTRIEMLRDIFVWAYERSAAQYRIIRASLEEPDPIRFRYREALAESIRRTVADDEAPSRERLRKRGVELEVPPPDQDAFAERALEILLSLHEGNVTAYRIDMAAFSRWSARRGER